MVGLYGYPVGISKEPEEYMQLAGAGTLVVVEQEEEEEEEAGS